jgi:hypothetical protein
VYTVINHYVLKISTNDQHLHSYRLRAAEAGKDLSLILSKQKASYV